MAEAGNASTPWRISRAAWMFGAAVIAVLGAFVLIPALDLRTSAAFYVPGQGFPWKSSPLGAFVRHDLPPMVLGLVAASIIAGLVGIIRHQAQGFTARKIIYLLATLVVGPGILVESLLKTYSGRARPEDLTMFGGQATYTSPLWPADACHSNCSFVSGHAALAFWVTAYAFIVPTKWRSRTLVAGLLFGCAVGAMRVMQGAHFASDVAYAAAVVLAVNVLLARLILIPGPAHGDPDAA